MCQKSPKKYIVIANQCRNTDVALSKDSLRSQSPDFSENYRQGAKAPLSDQGWCSAQRIRILMIASGNHTLIYAAPVRTLGLRGSELSRSDNPSVMALRETAMTAPFTQGSRGCSRTSAFCQYSFSISRISDRDFPWALAMAAKSSYSDFSRQTP